MNKFIAVLLVCILILIGIGDYFLIKIDKDVGYLHDSYVRESYAAEKELWNELLEANSNLVEINAKLSVIGGHLVSND